MALTELLAAVKEEQEMVDSKVSRAAVDLQAD